MPSGSVRGGGIRVDFSINDGRYIAGARRVTGTNTRLAASYNSIGRGISRQNQLVQQFGNSLRSSIIATIAYAAGINALRLAIGGSARAFLDFEKGLISVQKTTNLTDRELASLEGNFEKLLTQTSALNRPLPVTAKSLLEIAEAAGQMRIQGVRNITTFTEAVALLGLTTDLVGAEAARAIGLIIQNTQAGAEDALRIGSQLTALGNQFRGGESGIIKIAEGLARSTAEFRLNEGVILGYSAVLAASGARAETSATVFQRSLRAITGAASDAARGVPDRLQVIADAADVTFEELLETIQSGDLASAFRIFLQGLNNLPNIGAGLTRGGLLRAVFGEENVRISQILGVLTTQLGEVDRALGIVNQEGEKSTAILEEAGRFAEARALRLTAVTNQLESQARVVGNALTGVFVPVAEAFRVIELGAAGIGAVLAARYGSRAIRSVQAYFAEVARVRLLERNAADVAVSESTRRRALYQNEAQQRAASQVGAIRRIEAAELRLAAARRAVLSAQRGGRGVVLALAEQERATRSVAASQVYLARTQNGARLAGTANAAAQARLVGATGAYTAAVKVQNVVIARQNVLRVAAVNISRAAASTLAFLGGPIGAVTTALTLGATAWFLWGNRADEATRKQEEIEERLRSIAEEAGRAAAGITPDQSAIIEGQEALNRAIGDRRNTLIEIQRLEQDETRGGLVPGGTTSLSLRRKLSEQNENVKSLQEALNIASAALNFEGIGDGSEGSGIVGRFREIPPAVDDASRAVREFANQLTQADQVARQRAQFDASVVGIDTADAEARLAIFERQAQIDAYRLDLAVRQARALADQDESTRRVAQAQNIVDAIPSGTEEREDAARQLQQERSRLQTRQLELQAIKDAVALAGSLLTVDEEGLRILVQQERVARELREEYERITVQREAIDSAVSQGQDIDPPDFSGQIAEARDYGQALIDLAGAREREASQILASVGLSDIERAAREASLDILNQYEDDIVSAEREITRAEIEHLAALELLNAEKAKGYAADADRLEFLSRSAAETAAAADLARVYADVLRYQGDIAEEVAERVGNASRVIAEAQQQQIDAFSLATELATSGVQSLEDAIASAASGGGANVRDLAASILEDLARILARAYIVANAIRAIGAFGGGVGGAGVGVDAFGNSPTFHSGGIAGTRSALHRGALKPKETVAVLERGEEILTRNDPRHRFNMRPDLRSYFASLPRFHEGGVVGGSGGHRAGGMQVAIEIINPEGPPKEVARTTQRLDHERVIVGVVLKNINQNGDIPRALANSQRRLL